MTLIDKKHGGKRDGFSLIEGILAAGLLGMLVTSLVGLFIYGQESTRIAGTRMIAVFLAEEGMEAARNIRDDLFTNLVADTDPYAITTVNDIYELVDVADPDVDDLGIYTRTILIESETLPIRKKVTSTVTWPISPARTGTVTIENHFTEWTIP